MTSLTDRSLENALNTLGELLEARSLSYELVIVGGGSLLLQGQLRRATQDLDVVARVEHGAFVMAEPLPDTLAAAVGEVGDLYSLGDQWLNPGPTDLLRFGLPDGFADRMETRRFRTLTLHLAARLDQIAFKLYAAVDHTPHSKHFRDLQDLAPTGDELRFGAQWAVTHDTSTTFEELLRQVLEALGVRDADLS